MSKLSSKVASVILTVTTTVTLMGPVAGAQTSLEAQIAALLAQVAQLQAQLGTTVSAGAYCSAILASSADLTVGSRGAVVKAVQQALNAWGFTIAATGAGSVGNETEYFGSLTKTALAKFQTSNAIAPAVGYYGPKTRASFNAKCGTTGGPIPTTPGNVVATLAVTNPGSRTLVETESVADLAHFTFTGNGTLNSLTFKRVGVSADTTLSNIYLFNGNVRVTDAGSVSGASVINFTNLNLAVNGSLTLALRADIADTTAGQTVGVQLTGATLISGTVTGFPLSGSLHTIAADSSLATVALGTVLPSSAATTDPGTAIRIWESPFSVGNRDVVFERLALRQINSINNADLKNFQLLVDGVVVATASGVDANGYVTFSGFAKTLTTGTRTVKVLADLLDGSSRIVQMSLRNKADISVRDSQYGVYVSATYTPGSFPASTGEITVNSGTITVVKATDSPSGNVVDGAADQVLGRWTFTAYGEPVKVETLTAGFDRSDVNTASLRNGRILVNGSQVGSTATLNVSSTNTIYTTNFTVVPGTPATVELRADLYDNDGTDNVSNGDTITAQLEGNSSLNNAQRVNSLGTVDVPGSDTAANQLTVAEGTMTLGADATYPGQTTVAPRTAYKLGDWNLTNGSTEDVYVHTFSLDIDEVTGTTFNESDLTDVYMKYGATQTTVKPTVTAADNDWTVNFTLAKNQTIAIELYGNIGSGDNITDADSVKTDLTVTGTGAGSGATVTQSDKDGQTITEGTGSLTEALGASNPVTFITEDNVTKTVAAFKWTALNDNFTITEIVFDINACTTVNSVIIKDGTTTVGTQPCLTTDTTFAGLAIPVANGTTKELTVEMNFGTVGLNAGTSREDVAVTLDSYRRSNSQGVSTQDSSNEVGNSVLVFASTPTITQNTIGTSPILGSMEIGKWTVQANGGSVAIKQFGFAVTITDNVTTSTLTLGSFILYKDGSPYSDSVTIRDQAGNNLEVGGSTFDEADTAVYITAGSAGQGEEVISGSAVYSLWATPAGFGSTEDDSFRVQMLSDATSALRYLADIEQAGQITASEVVAGLSNAAGTSTSTQPIYLIWSDNSAVPHTATLTDATSTIANIAATSSGDWTNGYLVKNMPLAGNTFTY